ncbi:molybdopterin converting factor subunit 1 [Streptomyces sp. NRRL F-2664]|uniref:molybdopterin converting factor subunit 1 n=1 Tax=Streptomyces sp. NRRL F-2664 TaxID=1463842 RepID=UPI0009985CAF|nr:molybdopterin converting factor subunit 1 [Streptomyces sp. NRRL F-2664]
MSVEIELLYFGILREQLGVHRESVSMAAGATVGDLVQDVGVRHPRFAYAGGRLRIAVNEEFAKHEQVLRPGDTVAFIPPIAGGSDRYCVLTDEPLRVEPVLDAVRGPDSGGLVVFIGTVRNESQGRDVVRLHYEAYPSMVLRALNSIIDRCELAAEGVRVAVAHRTGDLQVGETAVVLAAAAPHRADAFTAARTCIELLKQEVPIWKKEFSADGAEWVGMRP